MKNTIESKTGVTVARLFTLFALVAFAYFLSVGPVLSVAERLDAYNTPVYKPLRVFYSPVFAIARLSDPTTRLYESYARMWCRIALPSGAPGTEVPAIAAFRNHPTPETQAEFDRQERASELDSLAFSAVICGWMIGAAWFAVWIWRAKLKLQQSMRACLKMWRQRAWLT